MKSQQNRIELEARPASNQHLLWENHGVSRARGSVAGLFSRGGDRRQDWEAEQVDDSRVILFAHSRGSRHVLLDFPLSSQTQRVHAFGHVRYTYLH